MNYRLLWLGRRAQDPLHTAADGYAARLGRYATLNRFCLRDTGDRHRDARSVLARLEAPHPQRPVVVLDEGGETLTSQEIALRIQSWFHDGVANVVFIIGGADGLDPSVRERATQCWSLSALTLPHRLAQVLLLEQLYRAHTILRGERYHRP